MWCWVLVLERRCPAPLLPPPPPPAGVHGDLHDQHGGRRRQPRQQRQPQDRVHAARAVVLALSVDEVAAAAAVTVTAAAVAVAAAAAPVADEALVGVAKDVTAATVTLDGNSIRPRIPPPKSPRERRAET